MTGEDAEVAPRAIAGAAGASAAGCEAIEQRREALPVLAHLPRRRNCSIWLRIIASMSDELVGTANGTTQLRCGCLQVRQPPRHALQQLHRLPEAARRQAAGRQSLHPLRHELCKSSHAR